MIRYALRCPNDHTFEAWFGSGDAFERQCKANEISCPACGDTMIDRQLMAPAIAKSRNRDSNKPIQATAGDAATAGPPPPIEILRAMKRHILANSENVGPRFAEEARAMHEGTIEQRSIRGETTPREVHELIDEGVPFGRIPVLPEDHN